MTVKGGSRPACAACRFQRRRCSSDCPLAPYFPANQPKVFQNVHRLYGVGNMMKILNQIKDDDQKEEAMKSIKYESHIRQMYPVHGCHGTIVQLHQNLVEATRELQSVNMMLDAYKKKSKLEREAGYINNVDGQVVGGSSDWGTSSMMNVGNDLGFFYDGLGDHNGNEFKRRVMALQPSDWDDEKKTINIDSAKYKPRFDEFQFCNVEQGDGSPDYTEIMCRSFVDDHQDYELKI
ncbi:LOB domain-containing protein [Artemisia annua]|uniref:LOB domain-containing protein n=1 Tax=Artemisia annua TaxID=35608 RepID=A0A2U1L5V5_ARTAN|nr:LOB domain-containing protein [Artemisia annua]